MFDFLSVDHESDVSRDKTVCSGNLLIATFNNISSLIFKPNWDKNGYNRITQRETLSKNTDWLKYTLINQYGVNLA